MCERQLIATFVNNGILRCSMILMIFFAEIGQSAQILQAISSRKSL